MARMAGSGCLDVVQIMNNASIFYGQRHRLHQFDTGNGIFIQGFGNPSRFALGFKLIITCQVLLAEEKAQRGRFHLSQFLLHFLLLDLPEIPAGQYSGCMGKTAGAISRRFQMDRIGNHAQQLAFVGDDWAS